MIKGRTSAGLAAVVVALGAGLAVTPAAQAATSHTVTYSCKIPVLGTRPVPTSLTLSAPAKGRVGQTVTLSVKLHPAGLPAVVVTNLTVQSALTESGAVKGSVKLSGHQATANSGNLNLTLTGKLKLAKTGTIRFTAGSTATFSLTSSIIGKATLSCTAVSKLPVLGSITVAKAGHGAAARRE